MLQLVSGEDTLMERMAGGLDKVGASILFFTGWLNTLHNSGEEEVPHEL